jgi:altronate dehydratase small subunit
MPNWQPAAIAIKEPDNVATALKELKSGDQAKVVIGKKEQSIRLKNDIKFLHKFALMNIKQGQTIIKYGQVIGEAIHDINKGEHVHIHNLRSLRGQAER